MERLVALPLFGFLTVMALVSATGGFEGVAPAVTLGNLVVGLLGVLGVAAGFAFARGLRESEEDEHEDDEYEKGKHEGDEPEE